MRTFMLVAGLVALAGASSNVAAQRVAPGSLSARWALPATLQAQTTGRASPSIELMGGLATGDGIYDLGLLVGASFGWLIPAFPLDLRFDPSLSRYSASGVYSGSLTILAIPAALEYKFKNVQSGPTPYVLGGVGLYYSHSGARAQSPIVDAGVEENSFDVGITIGGGIRLNTRFGLEGRIVDVSSFTTIPILLSIRL
ncbi:MAG: hypothetical protein ACT4P7_08780 [Gemmatimonadaceae bacterium]